MVSEVLGRGAQSCGTVPGRQCQSRVVGTLLVSQNCSVAWEKLASESYFLISEQISRLFPFLPDMVTCELHTGVSKSRAGLH